MFNSVNNKNYYTGIKITIMVVAVFFAIVCITGCGEKQQNESSEGAAASKPSGIFPKKEESKASTTDERIREILDAMTIKQKIGQVMLVRCPQNMQIESMRTYQFGGYVLYEQDFKDENDKPVSAKKAKETIAAYSAAPEIAPFIAVDEEGGSVVRASANKKMFPEGPYASPRDIYNKEGEKGLYKDARKKSERLLGYGINMNLAPVADVVTKKTAMMYDRAIGTDGKTTARLVKGMVAEMDKAKIAAVLKHFPGYGNNADSHKSAVTDKRSINVLRESDFLPFKAGVEAGAAGVMLSHVIQKRIDERMPASLSSKVNKVLRKELEFDGVTIVDDLWMLKSDDYGLEDDAAVMAISAGNDMMISTAFEQDFTSIYRGVMDKKITESRLDESVSRILRWKLALGIIE